MGLLPATITRHKATRNFRPGVGHKSISNVEERLGRNHVHLSLCHMPVNCDEDLINRRVLAINVIHIVSSLRFICSSYP
jgi:hypothetical protein